MFKNKKTTIIIAIVAALLLLGTTAGVVLAQTGSTNPGSANALLAKVASKLGIDQQKLEAAFSAAQKEMRDERLQNLVTQGKITQQQLDQYKKWLDSRPDTKGYQDQLKNWQQTRPPIPPDLKTWQDSKPNVPLPGFGGHFKGSFGR